MLPVLSLVMAVSCVAAGHEEPGIVIAPTERCSSLGWYRPQVGDLFIFQSTGLRNIVYSLACSGGATHSAVVVARPDGSLGLLEAPGPQYPVMISDIPSRLQFYPGKAWIRRRRTPLTSEQNKRLTDFSCSQEGKPFDTAGFVYPMFALPVRKHSRCLTAKELDQPRWFCSELCVAAYAAAGLMDARIVKPKHTDPEDLKTDGPMDLSRCWEKPIQWFRCGPKAECWWSKTCCGKVQWWRE